MYNHYCATSWQMDMLSFWKQPNTLGWVVFLPTIIWSKKAAPAAVARTTRVMRIHWQQQCTPCQHQLTITNNTLATMVARRRFGRTATLVVCHGSWNGVLFLKSQPPSVPCIILCRAPKCHWKNGMHYCCQTMPRGTMINTTTTTRAITVPGAMICHIHLFPYLHL